MAFKDYHSKKILKCKLVDNENYASYKYWVDELIEEWWIIKAIVCDWKRWLLWNIKPKIKIHRGLKKERKIKLILSLLYWKF